MPVTKHNWLITDANDVPRVIREAFHVATTGRPGPVLVDMPKDVSNQMMEWYWPEAVDLPGYKPNTKGHPKQIKDAARLMGEAERPVIYAGGGILKARAAEALRELVELTGFPVVTTLMGARHVPRRPRAVPRHAGHARQLHRGHVDAEGRPAHRARLALRRPGDGQGELVRARRQDHPRRHRPRRARQGAPARRADRRRLPPRDRGAGEGGEGRPEQARVAVARRVAPAAARVAGALPAPVRAAGRRPAEAAVLHRHAARQHARRHDRRVGCGPAPDVDQPALDVQPPLHVHQLGRPRHDGLRGAGGHRRQGRQARAHGVGGRRRRLLPDDGAGARHRERRAHPGEGGDPQQRVPRDGAPVAGALLRGALQRGVPLARPARLREVGRGDGLRRVPRRHARRGRAHDREGERDRRPAGGDRLPHRLPGEGVPDGRGGRVERRHHPRPRARQYGAVDAESAGDARS